MKFNLENPEDHGNYKTIACIIGTLIHILKDALKLLESLQRRMNGMVEEVKE